MRHVDTDVLIIGGGPAGGAAAIMCAERGLRVVVLERDGVHHEQPGETLHPGVEPLLAQLGVASQLPDVIGARHAGIWLERDGMRRFEAYGSDANGPWLGMQVMRGAFDALLLSRAAQLGADIRRASAVIDVVRDGDTVTGVTSSAGPVSAHVVVDATGRARWLARQLGIESESHSPQLIARYGYVAGNCPQRDDAPCLAADAAGWTWSARVRPNVYQWTRLVFDRHSHESDAPPEELRTLKPLSATRGADVTWRMLSKVAGPGWFAAGDAAAILDPTSSHGVLKAIMSGMMAAHLAAGVVTQNVPAAESASTYHQWLSGWFLADAERLSHFYRELGVEGFALSSTPVNCT